MRADEIAMLRAEIKRRLVSPRYLLALAVLLFFVWGVTNQMRGFEHGAGTAYNAWDVFLGALGGTGSPLTTAFVLPMTFVFLLGASLQEDVRSGYSLVVQARLGRKNAYWWVKVAAAFVVVAVTVAAMYALSLGVGVVRGFALSPVSLSAAGGNPNAWAMAKGAPPAYYSLPAGTNVLAHGLLVAAYFVFAYFAVVIAVMGVTARSKNLYAPLAIGALLCGSGLATSYAASDLVFSYSLFTALTESMHRPIPVTGAPPSYAVPWSHSVLLLGGLLAAGLIVGTLMTPTRAGGGAAAARGRLSRRAASAVRLFVLVLAALLASGCAPADFVGGAFPDVPAVELSGLTRADHAYLRQVSAQTVAMAKDVDRLNGLWGPEYLHVSDEKMASLLSNRLAGIRRDITAARGLETPPHLAQWRRVQYDPGLAELQYVVDDLGGLYAKRDHVGVWMCRKHIDYANAYLSAAGQTIAPFAGR